jgi:1-acylglycerone phosphate reductase
MELRPLGIHVTLLVPGLLETHIRSNPSAAVIPEHSLYGDFQTHVSDRLAVSLHMPAMPTEEFARRAVDELLKPRPPRYLSLGGLAWQVELLRWLPRGLVLFLLWLQFFKLPSILRMLRIL